MEGQIEPGTQGGRRLDTADAQSSNPWIVLFGNAGKDTESRVRGSPDLMHPISPLSAIPYSNPAEWECRWKRAWMFVTRVIAAIASLSIPARAWPGRTALLLRIRGWRRP